MNDKKYFGLSLIFFGISIFLCFIAFSWNLSTSSCEKKLTPYQRYLIVDDSVVERIAEVTGLDIDANGNLVDREHPSGFTAAKENALKETFIADAAAATEVAAQQLTQEPESEPNFEK